MLERLGTIKRNTLETNINLSVKLDGEGKSVIDTSVPFLDHMLILWAKHGMFDLNISATGDVEVDDHHTVEDIGICLGKAFCEALGDKTGIRRYGTTYVPMDESLAMVSVDISGRAFLVFNAQLPSQKVGNFDSELVEEFLRAFAFNAGITLHVNVMYGKSTHHIIEAIFKALGRALKEATSLDPSIKGVMSTKGQL